MSLLGMLESTGVNYRPTTGRDAQQGKTQDPFVAVSPPVPCSVQPASTGVVILYAQRLTKVTTSVYFAQDIGAEVNDRFHATNPAGQITKLLVRGYMQQVDRMRVWRMDAEEISAPKVATAVGFVVNAPSAVGLGIPFGFTVQAVDAMGNPVSTYTGTVQFFAFTDELAVLPGPTLITGGIGSFSATLNTEGYQTLFAQDINNVGLFGDSDIILVGAEIAHNFIGSEFQFIGSEFSYIGAE